MFDLSILLLPVTKTLEERLLDRWVKHEFSVKEAREKANSNDIPNAKYVLANSGEADIVISEFT
ncbi:MAG: hypothetical protein WBC71_07745 [Salaquimonas sp.]